MLRLPLRLIRNGQLWLPLLSRLRQSLWLRLLRRQ
jgi:hypothetical protein